MCNVFHGRFASEQRSTHLGASDDEQAQLDRTASWLPARQTADMAVKVMVLRRDGSCAVCSTPQPVGTRAEWDSATRAVTCLACVEDRIQANAGLEPPDVGSATEAAPSPSDPPEPPPLDIGDPGRSARDQFDRRHAKREAEIEGKWGTGRIGRVAKFLSDDPQTTTAWAKGARGEMLVAQILADELGDQAVLLHDRKVPGTRGNIDHLAIASSGVWVIDAKHMNGTVERRDVGRWFTTDVRLYVGGRDQTKKVTGLGWQVEAVATALGSDEVPIYPALAFVRAEWPIFLRKPLHLDGVCISWPTKLAELIAVEGPLTSDDIDRIARTLSTKLPSK